MTLLRFIASCSLVVFTALQSKAQIFEGGSVGESIGFGTKIHLSYSRVLGDSAEETGAVGWGGGLIVPLKLTKLVYLQSEFTFTRSGKLTIDQIALPVLFLQEEEKGFRFGGGPFFALIGHESIPEVPTSEFAYGVVADLSYYLAGIQVGFRGSFSLNDVVDHTNYETTAKQHLLAFELYYAIDIVGLIRNM
jgi:hypothetical protein